jgi:hypothetical protein
MKALTADDPRLLGEFRLRGRLGEGGMGGVYLGLSPGGRSVAIKVVHPSLASDSDFLRLFQYEVASAKAVSGIYTAPVVATGLEDQRRTAGHRLRHLPRGRSRGDDGHRDDVRHAGFTCHPSKPRASWPARPVTCSRWGCVIVYAASGAPRSVRAPRPASWTGWSMRSLPWIKGTGPMAVSFWPESVANLISKYQPQLEARVSDATPPAEVESTTYGVSAAPYQGSAGRVDPRETFDDPAGLGREATAGRPGHAAARGKPPSGRASARPDSVVGAVRLMYGSAAYALVWAICAVLIVDRGKNPPASLTLGSEMVAAGFIGTVLIGATWLIAGGPVLLLWRRRSGVFFRTAGLA